MNSRADLTRQMVCLHQSFWLEEVVVVPLAVSVSGDGNGQEIWLFMVAGVLKLPFVRYRVGAHVSFVLRLHLNVSRIYAQ